MGFDPATQDAGRFRFTDHAAARAFEHRLDHERLVEALGSHHFEQAAIEGQRSVHYVNVDGRPVKVVTEPHYSDLDQIAIITVSPLDVSLS